MTQTLTVLVYSDNRLTRQRVRAALGHRPAPELPRFDCLDVATYPMLLRRMDSGGVDLAILDGESTPAGGLGLARQFKDEFANCPPLVVLTGRPADSWLARWSRADQTVPHPLDPVELADSVVALLRRTSRAGAISTPTATR